MLYSPIEGKSTDDLRQELKAVYNAYPEYNEEMSFADMIRLFRDDDFYNLHLVAKEFMGRILKEIAADVAARRKREE